MRKLVLVIAVAALAAPLAALAADPPSSEGPGPAQACAAERTAIGTQAFRDLYGTPPNKSNAFGKCVSKKAKQQQENHDNAVSQCRAEQSDPNFAANHVGKTFEQFYGTGNGKNAFGKCVSGKAKAENQADQNAEVNAAKQCKKDRAADLAAFKAKYGTRPNAFGKCVSQRAKQQQPQP
jgi:hypothetical protein